MDRIAKGRRCKICGKLGGMGSTTILRALGYDIPKGEIGYAHSSCFQKKRKADKLKQHLKKYEIDI